MDKLISVIIPIYNTELHLLKCLESVVNQTYSNLQILLINDGSTDKSGEICKEYELKDKRIQYFYQNNKGVSSARNFGLEKSKGDYIHIIDSDDWLELHTYEFLIHTIQKQNADTVIFEYYIDYDHKHIKHQERKYSYGYLNHNLAVDFSIFSQNSFAWSRFYTKKCLKDIKFKEDVHWGEETIFIVEALKNTNTIYYCCIPLYHYYQSPISATRSKFNPKKLSGISMSKYFIQLMKKKYPRLLNKAYDLYSSILTELLFQVNSNKNNLQIIKYIRYELIKTFLKSFKSKDIIFQKKIKYLIVILNPKIFRFFHKIHIIFTQNKLTLQ